MRILLDITHPAHLHFFRHTIDRLRAEGCEVLLTARQKDSLHHLAAELGYELRSFGGTPRGMAGMAATLGHRQFRIARLASTWRPDLMAAVGGTFIAPVGALLGIPTAVFSDTESAVLSNRITYPFATRIYVPDAYREPRPSSKIRYPGFHELAYLHPSVFTPDPSVRGELGVAAGEPYCIVRLVGWAAAHDLGRRGIGREAKLALVRRLAAHGRVFISSEGELPGELAGYAFPLPCARMHDALAFASLIAGESSTMSSEAAMLGVPSVFLYPRVQLGVIEELAQRWQILHWFSPEQFDAAISCAEQLLASALRDREYWRSVSRRIVESSVDVSQFLYEQLTATARRQAA